MRNIVVFFKSPNAMDYPFNKKEYYDTYQLLQQEIEKLGANFFIVRDNKTYLGNGAFTKSWSFKSNQLVESGPITANAIYDKGEFISDNTVFVLNTSEINNICTDKWLTYQTFTEFCPTSFLVHNNEELAKALGEINTEKKVVKPVDGEEGHGVYIDTSNKILQINHDFPLLVQEFLDTSKGIPNIYVGIHDLRLVYINNQIVYAFYRTPPEGQLLANVAQGGNLQIINPKNIPKEVFPITEAVKNKMKGDYCISVDIGFVNGVPKIIELNSRPALFSPSRGKEFATFIQEIAALLVKNSGS
jgi:glutathione synthase/RimK-type ligase-like ATP-grasp enzyme